MIMLFIIILSIKSECVYASELMYGYDELLTYND